MENEIRIAADQIALRFLVTQLYAHKFFSDSQARTLLPEVILTTTKRDADLAAGQDDISAALMSQVHLSVERFFADVEMRLHKMGR